MALVLLTIAALAYLLLYRFFVIRLPAGTPPPSPAPASPTRLEVVGLAAALGLTLALGVRGIDRGLGYDELFTATYFVEASSFKETMSRYIVFNNHIAYSLLARLSRLGAGRAEWALRLPALVLALAGVAGHWWFSRRLLGPAGGLIAAALLADSPMHAEYSHSARGYTGLSFFTVASSFFYLRLLRRPKRSDIAWYLFASVLGIYFHLYAALVTMAQGVYLVLLATRGALRPRKAVISRAAFRSLWAALGAVPFLSGILYAPVATALFTTIRGRGRGPFHAEFPLTVLQTFVPGPGVAVLMAGTLMLVLGVAALYRRRPVEAAYLLLLLLLPLATVWLSCPADLYPRFFIFWLPFYTLFLAAGLKLFWEAFVEYYPPIRFMGKAAAIGLLAAWGALSLAAAWAGPGEAPFRTACRTLEDNSSEATTCCAIGGDPGMLQWYCRHKLHVLRSVPEAESLVRGRADFRCIYNRMEWEAPEQTRIAQFLAERATAQHFENITIFSTREAVAP